MEMEGKGVVRKTSFCSRVALVPYLINKEYLVWCHGLLCFEGGVQFDQLKARFLTKLGEVPRFRSRLEFKQGAFIDTGEELDEDYHFMSVKEKVSLHKIKDFHVGDMYSAKEINYSKPLWYATFFENVEDSGPVLLIVINHIIGDGISLMALLMKLTDNAAENGQVKLPRRKRNVKRIRQLYGPLTRARIYLGGALGAVASVVAKPDSRTPLFREDPSIISRKKNIALTSQLPLSDVKHIKNVVGGVTVNDVLVTLLNLTMINYLKAEGVAPRTLRKKKIRLACPMSTRKANDPMMRDGSPNNKIARATFRLVMTYKNRLDLLHKVKARLDALKISPFTAVQLKLGQLLATILPPEKQAKVFLKFYGQVTGVLSNLIGPSEKVYIAGSKVENFLFGLHSMGGMFLGLLTYDDKVNCCVCLDDALGNPNDLAKFWQIEFEELLNEVNQSAGVNQIAVE